MNPFELRGPEFLLFYLALSVTLLILLVLVRQSRESGALPSLHLDDPYLLACLSGGPKEVLRVSTISLVDRGLLQVSRGKVGPAATASKSEIGQTEVERQVASHFSTEQSFKSVFSKYNPAMESARKYEEILLIYRLVPDEHDRRARRLWTSLVATVLLVTGITKIVIAISRGRMNIEFLIFLAVAAVAITIKIGSPYRTRLGDKYLASVRALFTDLKGRAASLHPGGATKELLWLVALFGMSSVPATAFPFIKEFPAPQASSGSGCGSSGCGSGGGGCGGGCGGCGS